MPADSDRPAAQPLPSLPHTLRPLGVRYAVIGFGLMLAPLLNDSSSARGLMRAVDQRIGADGELALVAWREQHLLMAVRPPVTFGFKLDFAEQMRRGLAWQRQQPATRWLLVQDKALAACIDPTRVEHLGSANRRGWTLVPGAAA